MVPLIRPSNQTSNQIDMEKNEQLKKRIMELGRNAYERSIVTFSDFLDLNEQNIVHGLRLDHQGYRLEWFGGYEMSERQMIAFLPEALSYDWSFPIRCLHIQPKSLKYAEKLTHRDYLGALLNLGVLRCKMGDIIVNDDGSAYVFCQDKIAGFFLQEVCRIRHTNVVTKEVYDIEHVITHQEETISGTVASVRLDSVIALAFKTSRSSMIPFIEGGKVFVNGKLIISNGYTLKEEDIVSVRGKGKFRFGGITNKTKKGRYGVTVYRYV